MDTFIADIFQPRPAFDGIARFPEEWSTEAVKEMRQAMKRKNCAVTWAQLVIDQHGLLAFLRVANPLHLGNVKLAAKVLFQCLPAPFTNEQRCAVQKSLRPLDEVDRDRISAWQTVDSLRPAGQKRKRPCKQDESEQDYRPQLTALTLLRSIEPLLSKPRFWRAMRSQWPSCWRKNPPARRKWFCRRCGSC